jgi:hypothetical protein
MHVNKNPIHLVTQSLWNDELVLEANDSSLHAHLFSEGADGCHGCSIHLHLLGTSNLENLYVINVLIK